MNIAPFVVSGVLAPLQGLWRRLSLNKENQTFVRKIQPQLETEVTKSPGQYSAIEMAHQCKPHIRKPLRVVRVFEEDLAPVNVGRMLISGSMADVCAELDRLAAGEITIH